MVITIKVPPAARARYVWFTHIYCNSTIRFHIWLCIPKNWEDVMKPCRPVLWLCCHLTNIQASANRQPFRIGY